MALAVCFLFPSSSLGTQLCRSSSFGDAVPKPKLGNAGKAGAGGKLELPGQGVPKLELGNEGKISGNGVIPQPASLPAGQNIGSVLKWRRVQIFCFLFPSSSLGTQLCRSSSFGDAVPKPKLGNEGNRGEGK
jgi:hypothetical protein